MTFDQFCLVPLASWCPQRALVVANFRLWSNPALAATKWTNGRFRSASDSWLKFHSVVGRSIVMQVRGWVSRLALTDLIKAGFPIIIVSLYNSTRLLRKRKDEQRSERTDTRNNGTLVTEATYITVARLHCRQLNAATLIILLVLKSRKWLSCPFFTNFCKQRVTVTHITK